MKQGDTGDREQGTGNRRVVRLRNELEKGRDIADRLLHLAAAVIRLTRVGFAGASEKHIALQVVRSVTSAGANYEKARAAESRADFIHKCSIASKELRESLYWLRLIHEVELIERSLFDELDETNQLIAILRASIKTAREAGPEG